MKRIPIVSRKSIISRTAIYDRVACFSEHVVCEGCNLCENPCDCSGNKYDNDLNSDTEYMKVIHVDESYEDWDCLESQIWSLQDKGVYLRLIIDKEVPKEIIWATSYSEKNVIQINVNMIYFDNHIEWVQRLIYLSGNCGLYTVLFLYPIIPEIVKTYHVVEILDIFRNIVHFHVNLKFSEITNVNESEGYLNFNGIPISTKYLVKTNNGWTCSETYLNKFLDIVNIYAKPRKISVSICGTDNNCIGMGG